MILTAPQPKIAGPGRNPGRRPAQHPPRAAPQPRRATAGLGPGRDGVAYLGALLFAADDLVLCLFQGPSRAAVIQASDRLGIPSERLMYSLWLGPHRSSPEGAQK